MQIRIIREWDDHEPVCLGTLIGGTCYTKKVAINLVNKGWDKFQATEPDSDNDFLDFFLKDNVNFSLLVDDDTIDLVVG